MPAYTLPTRSSVAPQRLRQTLVAIAVTSMVLPALAQQVAAASTASGDDASLVLGTVTVTAQKRQQLAKDVPISMTVVSQETLEKTRAAGLDELQQLVPGFSMENQQGINTLTIRGIGGGGRNIGFDPRVGVYLDGIFIGQGQALRQPLFDIEQVEVLRGPQGHLFGRNTVAGAVNITTAAPSQTLEANVRLGLGNYGSKDAYASVSGPISDTVSGKISVASQRRDGFTKNLFDGQRFDDLQRDNVRGQLLIKPSSQLKISVQADTSSVHQKLINGEPTSDLFEIPLPGGVLPKRVVNFNTPSREDDDLSGLSSTLNYALTSGQTITAIVGYRKTHQITNQEDDYTPADLLSVHYDDKFSQTSQELRLSSPNAGSLRYVAGVYHLNETADTNRVANIGLDVATVAKNNPFVPFPLPLAMLFGIAPGTQVPNYGSIKTETYALFGALDVDVSPGLTLNLGARFTRDTKNVVFNLDGTASGLLGIGVLKDYRDSRAEDKLSPTAGLTYAVSKDQNVYAKYSRGFKSGGWNMEFLSANGAKNPTFGTETVDSVEVGTKGTLQGGRVSYELAAYSSTYKDFQVFQFVALGAGGTSIELRNAAKAQSQGVDASTSMRVSRDLDLGFNFAYVDATFKKFNTCSPLVDCTGNQLPYAPKVTAALTANYRLALPGLGGRVDVYGEYSYHGKSFMDPVNDVATQSIPSRQLVNVRVAYAPRDSRWGGNVWVKNLLNDDSVAARGRDFLGTLFGRRVDPRTFGVELKYSLD